MTFTVAKPALAAVMLVFTVLSSNLTAQSHVEQASAADQARSLTEEAKLLFSRMEYGAAKQKLDEVVQLVPKNADAYQFRSLAAFATGNYDAAAADAYDALGLGNSWTTSVIKSLYGGKLLPYQKQFAQLKRDLRTDSTMPGHFLLAYHHVVNQQWPQAKTQLEKVLELQPDEPLSIGLLKAVNGKLTEEKDCRIVNRR